MATDRQLLEMEYRNELFNWYYHCLGSIEKLIALKNEFIAKFGYNEAIDFQKKVLKEIAEQQIKDDRNEQATRYRKVIQCGGKVCSAKINRKRRRNEQAQTRMRSPIRKGLH